ncbi:MAG TPA: hypothetical protein VK504_08060 [Vicinamibacterales bacterium]|nr:hypothetical protein [Vicinamibacterales bacterium]
MRVQRVEVAPGGHIRPVRRPGSALFVIAPFVIFLIACGSSDPRGRALAIHTGTEWVPGNSGETVAVLRDNPPLSGILGAERGTFTFETPAPPVPARSVVWDLFEIVFDRSGGHTFRDSRNVDGLLGVAPVGPQPGTRPAIIRWQANGLLLVPGQPVSLHMRRRVFHGEPFVGQWQWDDLPDTGSNVVLDSRTKIVGVSVIVVTEPGGTRPRMDRRLAEMWIDSRAVDRLESAFSRGGSLNARVYDADHRELLDVAQTASPSNGRANPLIMQIPDEVWTVCGERYGMNIQFRLVNYGEVSADVRPNCAHAATQPDTGTPYCVGGWVAEAIPAGSAPTIPLVFVRHYGGIGVAQAWPRQGILFGELEVFGNIGARNPQNTLAHEIGHYLGGDVLFLDGAFGPSNLMADASRNLTREQCATAYSNADAYAVH